MKTVSDLGLLEALGFDLPSVQTNLRVDLPNEEKFMLPMHQDYASMRSHKAVRIWLPLRSVDKNNGTMTVVPGSNNEGPLEHITNDAKTPFVAPQHYERYQREVLSLEGGTGIIFDMLLLHETVMNRSDQIKFVHIITIQDLAHLANPDDPDDLIGRYFHVHKKRTEARDAVRAAS